MIYSKIVIPKKITYTVDYPLVIYLVSYLLVINLILYWYCAAKFSRTKPNTVFFSHRSKFIGIFCKSLDSYSYNL